MAPWSRETFDAEIAHADAESRKWAEYRDQLKALRDKMPLTGATIETRVNTNMVTTHRLAISKGRTGKDAFAAALRAAGFTLRSLAKRLDVPHSLLSMYRTPGGRQCPLARAEKIQQLTGWPADKAHWPNGLA